MKKQLILCMLVLLALCWYVTANAYMGNGGKYNACMEQATQLEEKEIYITAIGCYEDALTYKPNDYVAMYGIANDYKLLEEEANYIRQMEKMLSQFGPDVKILQELYDYYIKTNNLEDAAELAYKMKDKYPDNELVCKLYLERKGDYTEMYGGLEEISDYTGKYAWGVVNGRKGLVDKYGEFVIDAKYDEISVPGGESDWIAVVDGQKAYYLNLDGYKIAEPDETYTYLSSESSGSILAEKNGKYGYLNADFTPATEFAWEDATKIYHGIGAVKKDGKWALINKKFELVTEYIYDDVVQNDFKICSANETVWVKKGESYELLDKEGTVLTKEKYDIAKPFVSDEPCAVCKDNKWGFVSADGTECIAPAYDNAYSFNRGFAPVMSKDNQWGIIDTENNLVADYYFNDMKAFNDAGCAPVQINDAWTVIQMKIYE